jgi:glycosidase
MWLLLSISIFLLMVSSESSQAQGPSTKVSLSGNWLFTVDAQEVGVREAWFADSTDRTGWQSVEVPSFLEKYPGLATYDGWAWFARTLTLERTTVQLSLHFGGIDDEAVVWVNGVEVGNHSGYSDPFALDVTAVLKDGENTVVILVKDNGGGGGIYKPVTLVETRHIDEMFRSVYFGTPAMRSAEWVKDAVIYSVYLRSFSREGTFAGLEKRLPELKDMGVTVLWLLPIHPVGEKNRKGKLGSPYSVRDYYGINPEFGTMQDFKRLLAAVHRKGMKLIIDLVANHTAWDSKLVLEHPEWFTKDPKGALVQPNADWTDVVDLDYSQSGLRKYMIEMMRWWVKDIGIDGFRCDVAELVPTDFWEEAREKLNRIKPVMMLSEGSIPEHSVKAFDLTYSWNVYDALDPLLKGKRPATALDEIFMMEQLQYPTGALRMRFNTNHDKNASDSPAVLKYGKDGLKLTAVLINTIPGVPMIYTGEELANDRKLSLFEKVDVDWSRPREMGELYKTLSLLRRDHKALSRGELIRVQSSIPADIYAFFRIAGIDKILTVLNFVPEPRVDTLTIPIDKIFPGENTVALTEIFSGEHLEVSSDGQGRVAIALEPRGYKVFVVEKK